MPPTSRLKSGDPGSDKFGEIVGCKCIASSGAKIECPDEDTTDATERISQNPSENISVKLTVLNLSGQGLESFPETEDLSNVHVLNLSNNEISELPSSLKCARSLRVLNVSSNKFTGFPKVLTDSLHILKELNLSHNAIYTLPRPTCYQHLTELRARDCEISEFPLWILCDMHFLEVLDLSLNAIFFRMTPAQLHFHQSCNNLLRVNFSNTYMSDKHLPIISHFKQLQYLDVSNYSHKLTNSFGGFRDYLPVGLKVLKAIDVRMIEKVNLTGMSVEKMNLSHNSLVLLNEVNVSVHIRFLVLSDCFISLLPDNFGDMVHLEYLNLSQNDLCLLPDSFANLTELVHLDFYRNSFTEFPSELLLPLKKVRCFDMCMNPVDVPPYPLGGETLSYEKLRATLRSALTSPRKSGKIEPPPDPHSDCSGDFRNYSNKLNSVNRSKSLKISSKVDVKQPKRVEYDSDEDDEDFEAANENSSSFRPIVENCKQQAGEEEEEEEDWDAVDPNAIYNDATTSLYMGGLNRAGDLFAGAYEEDHFQMQLRRVPARIRDSPFFYYRTSYAVLPHPNSGLAAQPDTVVEGQFDDE